MSEETVTEPVAAEPAAPATPPEAPKPEPEPDWRAAYVGLQHSQNKAYKRIDDVLAQNAALADAIAALKEGQGAVLRQTVGEEEAKKLEQTQQERTERAAALRAAQSSQQFITAAIDVTANAMRAADVPEAEIQRVFLSARDTSNTREWHEVVTAQAAAAIAQAKATLIQRHEASKKAKTDKEVKAEAEALAQRQLKAAGIDKIDTAKGATHVSLVEKIRTVDRNSPEFARMLADAKAGRLTLK